jgi:hypothetical protein
MHTECDLVDRMREKKSKKKKRKKEKKETNMPQATP